MTVDIDRDSREQARQLLDFVDASPSPWHAVATMETKLQSMGFVRLHEPEHWELQQGGRYYVVRDGSSIIIFGIGHGGLDEFKFNIVGAHTDSPGLRVKPNGAHRAGKMSRIGVEVYGGPILATFSDRDLSLAGRIGYKNGDGSVQSRLVCFESALMRLPNLAIHMNREVNKKGLLLKKQDQLPLLLSNIEEGQNPQNYFYSLLADKAGCDKDAILSFELNVFDTQKGVFYGVNEEFIANSQLDNLASCHAGMTALLQSGESNPPATTVAAFFDHEEVGSESTKGADGSFLGDTLERISLALGIDREGYKRALAKSFAISADMAHAYQPNFPEAYEPDHRVQVNKGPVIKTNASQRYSSESVSESRFIRLCQEVDIPWQKYSHRTNIPCGSTIGPITAARLGIRSVDVGNPIWAMHSIRESGGVLDHGYLISVLREFYLT